MAPELSETTRGFGQGFAELDVPTFLMILCFPGFSVDEFA